MIHGWPEPCGSGLMAQTVCVILSLSDRKRLEAVVADRRSRSGPRWRRSRQRSAGCPCSATPIIIPGTLPPPRSSIAFSMPTRPSWRYGSGVGRPSAPKTEPSRAAPPPRADPSWVLYEVTAPAGAGKTREWARGGAQPLDPRRMVDDSAALPDCLGDRTGSFLPASSIDLAEFGATNVTLIHSRIGEAGQTVNQKGAVSIRCKPG